MPTQMEKKLFPDEVREIELTLEAIRTLTGVVLPDDIKEQVMRYVAEIKENKSDKPSL